MLPPKHFELRRRQSPSFCSIVFFRDASPGPVTCPSPAPGRLQILVARPLPVPGHEQPRPVWQLPGPVGAVHPQGEQRVPRRHRLRPARRRIGPAGP
ncbi:hypothetical protein BDY21DRAFT_345698 [Lineolata rhizophorae]|uniref:Uncharacterized protein n=1 Tax=Lineolata rhizophorae TaxID=578093 RepID=A0A6A6NY19_9PEZI|nr:hypothetical protein BDY21DRAFT_345698 [Lineolata rhizophorae]